MATLAELYLVRADKERGDMHTMKVGTVLVAVVFLSGADRDCSSPSSFLLDVSAYAQQTYAWCWAATGQIVMNHVRAGAVPSQCDAVNRRLDRLGDWDGNCCDEEPPGICLMTSDEPPFAEYQFTFRQTSDDLDLSPEERALSWGEIKRQIHCMKTPFAFSWRWSPDYESGHMMVAVGYSEVDGQRLVHFLDPLPVDESDEPVGNADRLSSRTYEEYIEQEDDHILGQAFYDVTFSEGG